MLKLQLKKLSLCLLLFGFLSASGLSLYASSSSIVLRDFLTRTSLPAFKGADFEVVMDKVTANPSTEAAAASIYLPMQNTAVPNDNYFYWIKNGAAPFDLSTAESANRLTLPLSLTTDANNYYLYFAMKSGSSYYITAKSSSIYSNTNASSVDFNLSVKGFCDAVNVKGTTICYVNEAKETSTTAYTFLSIQQKQVGDDIDPASNDYSGGIYFKINFSNTVNTNNLITNNAGLSGDRRIVVSYSATASLSKINTTYVIFTSDDTRPTVGALARTSGLSDFNLKSTQLSGVGTVTGLTNGVSYDYVLAFVDKYGFASKASNRQTKEALEIEELLKKKSCFLLTAGFGEEHFIIDYFRGLRDLYLSKFYLGRSFIAWYYQTAPNYAMAIYHSKILSSLVRGSAYIAYYLIHYFALWGILICLFVTIVTILRKKKPREA